MVASISSSTVSDWSNALFSKLDTKQQGYIEKADIEAAFAKTAGSGAASGADTSAADQLFTQLDSNKDGKITKSELSTAIAKVADELNAQYDQARVAKGGKGGPPAEGAGGPPPREAASSTSDTSTSTYNAAADTNGDGTVSADEAAAYAKLIASGATSATTNAGDTGLSKDQLSEKLQAAGSSDSRHAGALSKLVDNFDKADANGDGKLTRDEGRAYLESTRPGRSGDAGNDPASALAKALQLLKAYADSGQSSTSSQSVSVSA